MKVRKKIKWRLEFDLAATLFDGDHALNFTSITFNARGIERGIRDEIIRKADP